MLDMAEVLLTSKFFMTLPQSTKVLLKRPNPITSHLGKFLNDPAITTKKYWSIFYSFLHKLDIPGSPPIRYNNTNLTGTLVKVNTFNSLFYKEIFLD